MTRFVIRFLVASFSVGLLSFWLAREIDRGTFQLSGWPRPNDPGVAPDQPGAVQNVPVVVSGSDLVIEKQLPGRRVLVTSAIFPIAGWVVIYDNASGTPGNVVGAIYFPAGDAVQSGGGVLIEPTISGRSYFGAMHADDGDLAFEPDRDPPIIRKDGSAMMIEFLVERSAPSSERPPAE